MRKFFYRFAGQEDRRGKVAGPSLLGQCLLSTGSGSVYCLPGTENPAGGLTKAKSDMGPLLRMLRSETCCPGAFRPLQGSSFQEMGKEKDFLHAAITFSCSFLFAHGRITSIHTSFLRPNGTTQDAEPSQPCGGHRDSPSRSPASRSWSGSWPPQWNSRSSYGKNPHGKNREK